MTMPGPAHSPTDHDEMLIARLAADDLSESEAAEARALVASCPACAELHADLRSIMAATASLPAPRRARDFRLTDADAARLRRTGWQRLVGRFGDPRLAFTRPLATGLVALGIAGLVFAAAPSFLASGFGASAAAAPANAPGVGGAGLTIASGEPRTTTNQYGPQDGAAASVSASAVPLPTPGPVAIVSAAPPIPGAAASSAPSSPSESLHPGGPVAVAPASAPVPPPDNDTQAKSIQGTSGSPSGPSSLFLVSVVLLVLGIGLFLLRWVARRTA
jgi:anti-sigma factor RsiW